ncbi:rhombotarget lipoprotein [Thalassotalea aquiviva]|uniref:rhombotarget lipoprotein n=1 Tax=Thalassotalea aquiviva TaxID=3242415 RepID=UPI00352A5C8A
MKIKLLICLLSILSLTACSAFVSGNSNKKTVSSSLINYLYPDQQSRVEHKAETPTLNLPVRVGLAFVPSTNNANHLPNAEQIKLLEQVKASFLQYDYIESIDVIPSTYLTGTRGFDGLEQISRLYDVEVMALVSYDQVTKSYENKAAVLYWSIVGMYLIPGNDNVIQTFVDTAVFDIKSRKMLFRAPGINKVEDSSTAIKVDKTIQQKSMKSFTVAVDDMVLNLNEELARFKTRVKEENIAKVTLKKGYSGGSLTSWWLALLMGSLIAKVGFKHFLKQKR